MFNEIDKKQYKSIKAPGELKNRIYADIQNVVPTTKSNAMKYVRIVAACLVVVLCTAFVATGLKSSTVYLNDKAFYGESIVLSENVPSLATSRAKSNDLQTIEISTIIETEISIDNGKFTLFDSETGEQIYKGNKYSLKGRVVIQVELSQEEKAVLTLRNILSERKIALEPTQF